MIRRMTSPSPFLGGLAPMRLRRLKAPRPRLLIEATDGRIWDDPEIPLRPIDQRAWKTLQEPFRETARAGVFRRARQRRVIALGWHKSLNAADIGAAVGRWTEERKSRNTEE